MPFPGGPMPPMPGGPGGGMPPLPGPRGPMPPMPLPGVMGPGPVPGVSGPAEAPPDRLSQLARMIGETKAEDEGSAMDDMTQAIDLLQSAAKKDPRLADLVKDMLGILNKTQAPPPPGMPGPGGGMINTPQPLPGGGLPPGM